MVKLSHSGSCFEWVLVVKLGLNGLCLVLVVYVSMDYIVHFKPKHGWV
jgi:hypothetical protein